MRQYIGVDPSVRHTGIIILDDNAKVLRTAEIQTGDMPLLDALGHIRKEFRSWTQNNVNSEQDIFAIEKMMPTARSGPSLFVVQMLLLGLLEELYGQDTPKLVHPLPVQLKSYLKKVGGEVPPNKTAIVNLYKKETGNTQRVSSHIADAYFLARMARDVVAGRYAYQLSVKELPLTSWRPISGK